MAELLNITNITSESITLFQKLFEENIILSFNKLHDKIKEDISLHIIPQIRGSDCYDYTSFPEISIEVLNTIQNDSSRDFTKISEFKKMKINERIIWYYPCSSGGIFLTNNAKVIYCKIPYNSYESKTYQFNNFDFWIPIDYIKIITILTKNIKPCYNISHCNENKTCYDTIDTLYTNLFNILEELKVSLYSKFIPLYVKEENEQMKLELDSVRKEKAQFDIDIKPYVDLTNDRFKMEEERAESIRVLEEQRLKIDQENSEYVNKLEERNKKLDIEYEKFKSEKAKLDLFIIKYRKEYKEVLEQKALIAQDRIKLEEDKQELIEERDEFMKKKEKACSLDIDNDSDMSEE
jgi:hypothetical protein